MTTFKTDAVLSDLVEKYVIGKVDSPKYRSYMRYHENLMDEATGVESGFTDYPYVPAEGTLTDEHGAALEFEAALEHESANIYEAAFKRRGSRPTWRDEIWTVYDGVGYRVFFGTREEVIARVATLIFLLDN